MIRSRNIYTDRELDLAKSLSKEIDLPIEIALLLIKQNINNQDDAYAFFNPKFEDLHDPMQMKNMQISVGRIEKAIDENQKITIFCDYDVDGTSACSVLYLYFKSLGTNIDYHTPDRNNDGYGMNNSAVKEIVKSGTNLVITVDCGITNNEQVELLNKNGIDVIITDHHECGEELPETEYILNPKQIDCSYPNEFLSGSGIAFKVVQALCGIKALNYIDYAALGTIADIVPLTGENRVISKLGLEKMNRNISLGIGLLRPYVLPNNKMIDEYHIGFGFGPRINAAGRMETAHLALLMLLATKETHEAKKAAAKLNALNEQRKEICEAIIIESEKQIFDKNILKDIGAIFVIGEWEPGVVGICASRLAAKYARPVLIFAKKGEEAVCSARSIEAINIYDVLNNFSDYYIKFGGHHMAAGLTIKAEDFETIRDKVNGHIKSQYKENEFVPKAIYDIEIKNEELDEHFANAIKKLAPYGQGNPKPKLLFREKTVREKNYFGKQVKAHFKFNLKSFGSPLPAIKFYFSKKDDAIKIANIIGSLNISDFSGKPEIFIDYIESARIDDKMKMPAFAYENAIDNIVDVLEDYETKKSEEVSLKECVTYIKNMTDRSKFGLLVLINDVYQFELLIKENTIKDMIKSGKLYFKLEDEYNIPLNSIGFVKEYKNIIKSYDTIICFSDLDLLKNEDNRNIKRYIIKELNEKYKEAKKDYMVNKNDMSKIFISLKSMFKINHRFKEKHELYKEISLSCGIDIKKIICGTKILEELDLIDFEKSDIIKGKIVIHNEKKDLDSSKLYLVFKEEK